MTFTSLSDLDLKGKTVLLRADLNVPAKNGKVSDLARIERLTPTIHFLRDAGAKTLIISHFGRPEGKHVADLSLQFLAPVLRERWDAPLSFCPETVGTQAKEFAASLKEGEFGLLENVRFYSGEEADDVQFAQSLAELGDIYVNDAFSCAHRAHASTHALARLIPSAAGFLMASELNALNTALESPEKPLLAIVGGAKISTKLDLLHNMVEKTDILVLGGGMANTFLHASGKNVGASLCEKDMKGQAQEILEKSEGSGCRIILPVDGVCAQTLAAGVETNICPIDEINAEMMILDIGPETARQVNSLLDSAKTLVWNGPLGAFETEPFGQGTYDVARHAADLSQRNKLRSVAGGGDTLSALRKAGVIDNFSYVSTAGGAFLEWLEGKELPGIKVLCKKAHAA